VHELASSFGFFPGFRGVHIFSKIIDLVTPGASAGVSVGTDANQVIQILELTSKALADIVRRTLFDSWGMLFS
jgi:hypothetical protein